MSELEDRMIRSFIQGAMWIHHNILINSDVSVFQAEEEAKKRLSKGSLGETNEEKTDRILNELKFKWPDKLPKYVPGHHPPIPDLKFPETP